MSLNQRPSSVAIDRLFGRDWRRAARPLSLAPLLSIAILSAAFERSSAAEAKDYPLTVSVPVALAQTGPNGTLMSVGCEYTFAPGTRKTQARYVTVIKNGKGKTAVLPIKLEEQGMAAVLIEGWRPDDKPFNGYFAEQVESSSKSGKPELRPISEETEFILNPNQQ